MKEGFISRQLIYKPLSVLALNKKKYIERERKLYLFISFQYSFGDTSNPKSKKFFFFDLYAITSLFYYYLFELKCIIDGIIKNK